MSGIGMTAMRGCRCCPAAVVWGCDVGIEELGTTELSTLRGGERRGESGER